MFLRALGIFNRSSRLSQLLPQIEQIEPAPLLNQFAVLDANDGRERDRHVLAGRGNALKRGLMGAAYSQAVCNAVTLREDVLERRCCVGEGRPKSVCSRPLTLGSERCRRGIQMSSVTRREELLNERRAPAVPPRLIRRRGRRRRSPHRLRRGRIGAPTWCGKLSWFRQQATRSREGA